MKNNENSIKSNKGSTLITVIVVVAFISILATVLLYLVCENYKTKIYDVHTKESFYCAEEVVELMKARIAMDVAKASKPAFDKVVIDYAQSDNQNVRSTTYFTEFDSYFNTEIVKHWTPDGSKGKYQVFIESFFPGAVYIDDRHFDITINGRLLHCTIADTFDIDTAYENVSAVYDTAGNVNSFYIRGFKITVVDDKTDFRSIIDTSFEITPPMLNFGDEIKNNDSILDYGESVKYYKFKKE